MTDDSRPDPIVIALPDPLPDVNVNPIGFWFYGQQFLAIVQGASAPSPFSPVPYYVVSRSIELTLKAFLLSKGVTKKVLKNDLGHNLRKLLERAELEGLKTVTTLTEDERAAIALADDYYSKKGFEYFEAKKALFGYPGLPNLKVLHGIAAKLVTDLEQSCLDAG